MKIELPYNWAPRNYQMNAWNHMQQEKEKLRSYCVWHRRAGKDLLAINIFGTKVMQRVGMYWHMLPTYKQGRSIVWDGFTREGRKFLDHFHPATIKGDPLNNEMKLRFQNGSIYQVVGTDDVNKLVGTNPIGVVLSEYSLHDPEAWRYLMPILRENGGWAMFILTFRGKNHGYKMYTMAKKSPTWFSELLVAGDNGTKRTDGTPVISDADIQADRDEGMPEEIVQQEYYNNPNAALVGAYYSQQMDKADKEHRICRVPVDPMLPVDTFWDIGMRDSTCIIFTQVAGMERRIVDYYEASGEALVHYRNILKEKGYDYRHHYAPWDIQIKEFTSGRSRLETARKMGLNFKVAPQLPVLDGIENVRNMLQYCFFDEDNCERLIESLRSYRKEWDDKRQDFRDQPLHDWSSHAADAMRVMAWFTHRRTFKGHKPQETALDEYEYLG